MHTVRSLLNGQPDPVAPGGVRTIANPARLDEIVSEAHLGDAETFLQACRAAKAAKDAGLPPITFHSVRHSYATASLESGMPVMILSARLGHSTPALTLNVYSHALPATDKAEAARVAAELD